MAMDIFDELKQKIAGKNIKLVFPEGEDHRILKAALRLAQQGLVAPTLLGDEAKIADYVKAHGETLPANVTVINIETYPQAKFDEIGRAHV